VKRRDTYTAQAIYSHLWDPAQQFFVDVTQPINSDHKAVHGRDEARFYPFRLGVRVASKHADSTVQQLFNSNGFDTAYGPTTLERCNQ
jgi:hypothetical protein